MLVYLDGKENQKKDPADVPNENYARELLELHTLGVDGGYTQTDVYEAARSLTGWRLRTRWQKGTVYFEPTLHDDGEKRVLGQIIPAGGGAADVDRVVQIACNHPSTANHIATKLVRRFVSEDPPAALVARVANVFTTTGGDIKSMLRVVFTSDEFKLNSGVKFKRPFQFIVSCLRALAADTHAHQPLVEYLLRMGQGPFQYPTPDGYPDRAAPWLSTLLWRWNFAFSAAANQLPTVTVPLDQLAQAIGGSFQPEQLMSYFVGRKGSYNELLAIRDYRTSNDANYHAEMTALVLASPAFQRC
jgi:uncharacterized protein (DUF1800 family)